jgi:hypothetical protein
LLFRPNINLLSISVNQNNSPTSVRLFLYPFISFSPFLSVLHVRPVVIFPSCMTAAQQ